MANTKTTKKIGKIEPYEYQVNLSTSKDRRRCVERIKSLVRKSMELRDYIFYLKNYCHFESCIFYQHLSSANPVSKAKIEAHHGPLTIDDICDIVLQKWIDSGMEINELLIAEEVEELHYKNLVGLTPLSKTIHQIITNSDKAFVPIFVYYGEWMKFLEQYGDFIDDKFFDKIEYAIERTKNMTEEDFDALKVEFKYLEIDGQEKAEKLGEDGKTASVA